MTGGGRETRDEETGVRAVGDAGPYGWVWEASSTTLGSWRTAERLRRRGRGMGESRRKDHQKGDGGDGFPRRFAPRNDKMGTKNEEGHHKCPGSA